MADKKETIVILSPGFAVNEADTTCLPAQQVFIRALHKNFPALNIIIIAFEHPAIQGEYRWNNLRVISLGGVRPGKINHLFFWRKAWLVLQKIKRKNNITGLLSFWVNECALVGKYFGKLNRIKHYSWILGQDAKKDNIFIKLIRPKATEVIAMSDFLAAQFYNNYHIKPHKVIPNGIDVGLFGKNNKERAIDIFAAGSLIPLKQYDIFIETVKLVSEGLPQVKAMLCGKGPGEQNLQQLVKKLHVESHVCLAGEKQHVEVLRLMQQSKVFLHTSNYEGFSTVCLEALYAGAHVVSFFRPMEKDIPHWHIVQTKEEMAARALELLLNPSTEYTPVLPYSMDDIAKQVMALY